MEFSVQVDAARGGDDEALRSLFLSVYPMLHAEVTRGLPLDLERVISAEDILQDVFLEATLRLPALEDRGEAAFRAWMRTIAAHRVINAVATHKAAKRGGGMGPLPLLDSADVAGRNETPSGWVGGREDASLMMRVLRGLKSGQREILRLRFGDGLSPKSIAALVGKTPDAVGMATLRAIEALRRGLPGSAARRGR